MSLTSLRKAIADTISANVTDFKLVREHGGTVNESEIKRIAIQTPAALVAVLGGPVEREGGWPVGDVRFAVFVITVGTSTTDRKSDVVNLVEQVVGQVAANTWSASYTHLQAPQKIHMDNLYSGSIDSKGVALWAVTWTQRCEVNLNEDAYGELDDLNTVAVDMDLAPRDGIVEDQLIVELQGTLMSAYGRLHMATPAATSVAVAGTYQKAAGTTELDMYSDVDSPVTGRLRHTGTVQKPFFVQASASVEVSADATVTLTIAPGGVADEEVAIERDMIAADGAVVFTVNTTVLLDENEYVEVWLTADDTVNVTLTKLTLAVVAA